MEDILKGLNQEQRKAVTYEGGPLLIVAGAGTGKTTVITRRIAWLIVQKKALPEEILALTFTDKAAAEMEERVDILVPYGFVDTWISTFHAFGDRVLRDHALEIGLPSDFKVLSPAEQAVFLKDHLFEFDLDYYRPLGNPTRYIEALLSLFSRIKDEDISPAEYLAYARRRMRKAKTKEEKEEARQELEVAAAFQKYQELMWQAGNIDFGDQIVLTLKLFREKPQILKRYQKQFKYILVDEFQDTNYAQNELVKLLAGKNGNITVVADDDQCLPGSALISTPYGSKPISKIKKGEEVLTAVGKGHLGVSKVVRVFKNRKTTQFITFLTKNGYKVTVTDNHKMFCFVPVKLKSKDKKYYYVYLMQRNSLGWRIGITTGLAHRLKFERSVDKIIGLRAFTTESEARYFETLWSLKYNIPTVCFKERGNQAITNKLLENLYRELNTQENVKKLARDLNVDLNSYHYCLDAVTRGQSRRIKINFTMNYRNYRSKYERNGYLKNPLISHRVSLQTSNPLIIKKLKESGIKIVKIKKGISVKFANKDIKKVQEFAEKLQKLTGGIIEYKSNIGKLNIQHKPALIMPASNVLEGHFLPVLKDNKIIYDQVVKIERRNKTETVYDLEIDRTHNFIANGIVVHNSIYRFRGAAVSNVLEFKRNFRKSHQIVLTKNYRSTRQILDCAYQLIQHNNPDRLEVKNRINKRLETNKQGPWPQFIHCHNLTAETDKVASLIKEKIKTKKYTFRDFAILVRKNEQAKPFMRSLAQYGIPYKFTGASGLYDRPEVRLLISFMRALIDPANSLALYYLITSEVYKLPVAEAIKLNSWASYNNRSLDYIINHYQQIPEIVNQLKPATLKIIEKIQNDFQALREASRDYTAGQLIYQFLKTSGFLTKLVKRSQKGDIEAEVCIQNIAKFFEKIREFEHLAEDKSILSFKEHLDALMAAGEDPATAELDPELDAVNILTVHKAKGLEFKVVFLVNLYQGSFPARKQPEPLALPDDLIKETLPEGDYHLQEERRLFYVAVTRASDELYLLASTDYGGKRPVRISQFVLEFLDRPRIDTQKVKLSHLELIKNHQPSFEPSLIKRFYNGGEILSLNPHQIDDYLSCPLKFKYIHILRIPIVKHHAVIYGSAIHKAIEEYYRRKLNHYTVTSEDLIRIFHNEWESVGFVTRQHEEQRLAKGEEVLRDFFKKEERKKFYPAWVEKKFSFVLPGKPRVRVSGRYDAVYLKKETKSKVSPIKYAEIRDFKTGEVASKEKAIRRTKENRQMAIYALAWFLNQKKLPDKISLYFVDTGILGEAAPTHSMVENAQAEIAKVVQGILKHNFEAKPRWQECSHCAYRDICPYTASL